MASVTQSSSVRVAATPSEGRRFAPEQAKCDLVRPARAERTNWRVAEAHRLDGEVGIGVVVQLPFQHVREVVERAEKRPAGRLGDDDLAGLGQLSGDDLFRRPEALE